MLVYNVGHEIDEIYEFLHDETQESLVKIVSTKCIRTIAQIIFNINLK